jgi:hypothetical protein
MEIRLTPVETEELTDFLENGNKGYAVSAASFAGSRTALALIEKKSNQYAFLSRQELFRTYLRLQRGYKIK